MKKLQVYIESSQPGNVMGEFELKKLISNEPISTTLILHYGRCGSTVLQEILSQCDKVLHFGEYFNQVHGENFSDFGALPRHDGAQLTLRQAVGSLLSEYERMARDRGPGVHFIFEVKEHDFLRKVFAFGLSEFVQLLTELKNFRIVHLYRRNLLKQYVSEVVAIKSGIYHTRNSPSTPFQVQIDVTAARETILFRKPAMVQHAKIIHPIEHLNICYEEHVEHDPVMGADMIAKFLGGDPLTQCVHEGASSSATQLKKTNPFSLRDMILNYDEVAAEMESIGEKWMLE